MAGNKIGIWMLLLVVILQISTSVQFPLGEDEQDSSSHLESPLEGPADQEELLQLNRQRRERAHDRGSHAGFSGSNKGMKGGFRAKSDSRSDGGSSSGLKGKFRGKGSIGGETHAGVKF